MASFPPPTASPTIDLSGVNADSGAHSVRVRIERLADVGGGSNGPERIVLAQAWNPEDRDHGVADEFLDRPAVAFDFVACDIEVTTQQRLQPLRVKPLSNSVDPTTSMKRTETGLRDPAPSSAMSEAPQLSQNRAPSRVSCPQVGQDGMT